MLHINDFHAVNSRMLQIIEELDSGIDPAFDAGQEELEREFAGLRLQLPSHV
jgi:hypothetical protein